MTKQLLDACPTCGGEWSHVDETGKKWWGWVGGNVVNDRIVTWVCLHCFASWDRNDPSIHREAD